ncbi:tyrosine-type recombinase/integrase [Bradyrhizobium japonicum]
MDQQQSLGFKFRVQQILLRGYVSFAEECGDRHIRSARVLAWAARAPSPEQRRNRLLTVRRFALAMHAENPRHQVPAADALGHAVVKRRPPYIYSADEIARLLRAAAALRPAGSIRPTMYATLFGLLTATGMRIAEALALQIDDVTADGLVVRQTKFQKSRLLPLHATARLALDRYLVTRRSLDYFSCPRFGPSDFSIEPKQAMGHDTAAIGFRRLPSASTPIKAERASRILTIEMSGRPCAIGGMRGIGEQPDRHGSRRW